MARALTKMKLDGTPYVRPAAIERQIDEVSSLDTEELRQRLMIVDRNAGGYPRPVPRDDLRALFGG